jgi:hypothetical protein
MAAKGINEEGAAEKLREFLNCASRLSPVNMGDMRTGNMFEMSLEDLRQSCTDTAIVHAVFTEIDAVGRLLQQLEAAELGVSVVVSGLFASVRACCRDLDMHPPLHTVNQSLGVWGRTDLLPEPEIQQISTMCGHGMVSFGLIRDTVDKLRLGQLSIQQAASRLAKPCACGIFNPVRAEQLLSQMVVDNA